MPIRDLCPRENQKPVSPNHIFLYSSKIACAAFGKFKDEFLFDIYLKIQNHDREHGVEDLSKTVAHKDDAVTSANTSRPKKESKEPSVGMSNFTLSFTEEDEELPVQLPGGLLKKAKPSGDDVSFSSVKIASRLARLICISLMPYFAPSLLLIARSIQSSSCAKGCVSPGSGQAGQGEERGA